MQNIDCVERPCPWGLELVSAFGDGTVMYGLWVPCVVCFCSLDKQCWSSTVQMEKALHFVIVARKSPDRPMEWLGRW